MTEAEWEPTTAAKIGCAVVLVAFLIAAAVLLLAVGGDPSGVPAAELR